LTVVTLLQLVPFQTQVSPWSLKPLPIPAQLSLTFPLGAAGDSDWAVLWSGQSAALAKDTNAAELVQRLAEETTRRLRAFA